MHIKLLGVRANPTMPSGFRSSLQLCHISNMMAGRCDGDESEFPETP